MPYEASQTANTIIELVKRHFVAKDKFKRLPVFTKDYLDKINEALEEIYQNSGWQRDEFSITTISGQAEYPMDGADGHLPKSEIDLITRVDYDGKPLIYQYVYPDDDVAPESGDDSATPTGWYLKYDNGIRYLGLTSNADAEVTLIVYSWRIPVIITTTTGVPAVEPDFFRLIKKLVIYKFYVMMEEFDQAVAYANAENISGDLMFYHEAQRRRQGRYLKRRDIRGPDDLLE